MSFYYTLQSNLLLVLYIDASTRHLIEIEPAPHVFNSTSPMGVVDYTGEVPCTCSLPHNLH
jgi:hypothetical protein